VTALLGCIADDFTGGTDLAGMPVKAASGIADDVDVLVLAQASLAHLRDTLAAELPCTVLAGPPTLMREVARRCAG
jgi:hypothetical protein